jgi:hypothetical protein
VNVVGNSYDDEELEVFVGDDPVEVVLIRCGDEGLDNVS